MRSIIFHIVIVDKVSNCDTGVIGFLSNVSGNSAHLPISSSAMEQLWSALEQFVSFNNVTFVDFG